ncbi:MAG: beta-ketoacyl-[acyl-carrier-protein] synthase family protein, partial [Gammaproteobacteria bacterium]|nr:beta-ketoacyl-[acyl-carrier-protein] synthase family protein [Gammaproteobacteria bacterium]
GAQVPEFDTADYFDVSKISFYDRFSQLALISAREAIQDAGLASGDILRDAAVIIGTGCGGKHTDEATYYQLYVKKSARVHPLTIPKGMPSAAASAVSMDLGIKGPSFSVTSACASGAHAIFQAYSMIQSGMVDLALAGGTDSPFTFGLSKSWEALRVLSPDGCRPFSSNRNGMVLGEGAGIIVLESEQHALKRGQSIYAEIVACGLSSDADHMTRPNQTSISLAIHKALAQAEVKPFQVDYINAHGTGTVLNDQVESLAIKEVFKNYAYEVPISSSKSLHGHAMGASSALEAVATIKSIADQIIPPTANFTAGDEFCDLDYVPNVARKHSINIALSNSFAFGGSNAVLAFKRYI